MNDQTARDQIAAVVSIVAHDKYGTLRVDDATDAIVKIIREAMLSDQSVAYTRDVIVQSTDAMGLTSLETYRVLDWSLKYSFMKGKISG